MKAIYICEILLTGLLINSPVFSQGDEQNTNKADEGYGDAFVNYKPYVKPTEKTPDEPSKPSSPPQPAKEKKGKQTVDVDWLFKNYPLIEKRAIDDPTDVNVKAAMILKRIVLDKGQRYSEKVMEVNNKDPILNENNRVPYASSGAQSIRNANYAAQEQAVREMSTQGGLLVFVDGHCRFCEKIIPVMKGVKDSFGMEYMLISVDGTFPKNIYSSNSKIDNGLYKKLGLKLTPSVVYVDKPKGYQDGNDPNQYLIISQGFYAQDEMAKQIAFAGHNNKLLTTDTMRDLDVWDRGVANSDDLKKLELDPNKPETFAETVEPILIKQYK
jgi:conjugal transfer pilus assembly protein TraF